MRKTIILMSVLLAWTASLSAQKITREKADEIVINYLKSEGISLNTPLFVNANTPSEEGFTVTTSKGETVKAKYACWVYLFQQFLPVGYVLPYSYLIVKEDNGSLLEIVVNTSLLPDFASWTEVKIPQGIAAPKENKQSLYPNPVDDWLTIPCNGENTRVEIYDLKGTRLFSGTLSEKETCQINVSFLNAGVYMINVDGKMYKVVKK